MKRSHFLAASALLLALVAQPRLVRATDGLPEPSAAREPTFITPVEKTLANGLRVIVIERPGLPLLSAAIVIRSGTESDPPRLAGLAGFTASLLTQGTETRSATQIAREVESLGAAITATAAEDATTIALSTLSAQAAPAFALLADVVRHPKFAPEEIERQRRQALDDLRVNLEEPGTVARLAAGRIILGSGLYSSPGSGTIASLQRLQRAEITAFHAAHYAAGGALLVIAGNITAEAAFALADTHFGDWPARPAAAPPASASFTTAAPPRAILIDQPSAGQAAVLLGAPGIARTAGDYFPGLVANAVLGGGYTSLLNQEIRVKRGLSYGTFSTLAALRAGGYSLARCQTKNISATEVASLIRGQLQHLATDLIPAEFLVARQATLIGDFARDLETNAGYVATIGGFALHDLPLDSARDYPARIRSVTAEDLRTFARTHLALDTTSTIVVGRAKEIAQPLRKLIPTLEVIPADALDLDSPTLRRANGRH